MLIRLPLPLVLHLLVLPVVIVRAYQPPPGPGHHSTPKPRHQSPPRRPQYQPSSSSRQDLISTATTALAGCSSLLFLGSSRTSPAHATDAREAISKVISKVPGYGAPDILYPSFFAGEWKMTREVVGLIIPPEEAGKVDSQDLAQARAQQGEKLVFTIRFLPYNEGEEGAIGGISAPQAPRADVGNADKAARMVIADRGFNEENLWRARLALAGKSELYQEGVSSRWERTNPNVLTVSFPDGVIREVKVTKRSFESPGEDAFGSSEFCRVADAAADMGVASVPRLSALRVLRRWKRRGGGEEGGIEGLELVKYYPTVSLSADPPAVMTIKARLTLERIR